MDGTNHRSALLLCDTVSMKNSSSSEELDTKSWYERLFTRFSVKENILIKTMYTVIKMQENVYMKREDNERNIFRKMLKTWKYPWMKSVMKKCARQRKWYDKVSDWQKAGYGNWFSATDDMITPVLNNDIQIYITIFCTFILTIHFTFGNYRGMFMKHANSFPQIDL